MSKSIVTLTLLFFALFPSCNSLSGKGSSTLSPDAFEKKLKETPNAILLDVRTPEEYAEKHLKNGVNVDYNGDRFEATITKMDKNTPVFVYCLSGGRSAKAVEEMNKKGFKELYNLDGGILSWANAGKPVESATPLATTVGLSEEEYLGKLKGAKAVLVDFNAVWCGPCKKLKPFVDKMETEWKDKLTVLPIDVDKNPSVANLMHINGIPLIILYKNGKEVWRNLGFIEEKDLRAQVQKFL